MSQKEEKTTPLEFATRHKDRSDENIQQLWKTAGNERKIQQRVIDKAKGNSGGSKAKAKKKGQVTLPMTLDLSSLSKKQLRDLHDQILDLLTA
jgi:hypothetical protein